MAQPLRLRKPNPKSTIYFSFFWSHSQYHKEVFMRIFLKEKGGHRES